MTEPTTLQPVLLWSDGLIFLLVASLLAFVATLRRSPQTRQKWAQVFRSRIGVSSFMVVCAYVLVALLDSVHFRESLPATEHSADVHYSHSIRSVLDLLLHDMQEGTETTYSAPFAIYSFSKENMLDEQGRLYRDFPRLAHGGAHLADPAQRVGDILQRSAVALVRGALLAAVLLGLLAWLRRRRLARVGLPWRAVNLTLVALVLVSTWVLELGSVYHILGTDQVGTDVLYQSVKSIRTGVLIGTLATLLTLPLAIVLGIGAGYFKGAVDDVVQYVYTTLNSIPGILLIAASVLLIDVYIQTHPERFELTVVRADFKFLALCFILGLTSWTTLCRLLRAETLKISQLEYVRAAQAFGVSQARIIRRHILPNVMHLVLISLVLDFSAFVMAESVLSYIGVGVDASMMSWGNMINAARSELSRDPSVWWSVMSAFILMVVLVLAANLFADEVRAAFDPRGAGGRR